MKTAVISFTESGRLLSERIASGENAFRYCFYRHTDDNAAAFTDLSALISEIFGKYDALVFVCSVGIAVRAVAPHIRSKLTDPAVTAIDDGGRYAVSVLSGHIGGANDLTENIAETVGAIPVITTSTDVHGKFSPDLFATRNRLVICGMNEAKAVAAAVLNGDDTGIRCDYPHSAFPPELTERGGGDIGVCISGNPADKPFATTLNLLPANLIAGIGCKKGTPCDSIMTHIIGIFRDNGIDIRRLAAVATIDIKADEAGIKDLCERFSLPLITFTAEELMSAEGNFAHSDFVERTTGADNVCERAAVCGGGSIIVPKTARNGITAAVAELPVFIDFER